MRRAKREIARLGSNVALHTSVISTGWTRLDAILGGGLPRSSVAEVFGPELSGKTQLAAALCAHVLQAGGHAAFLDLEGSSVSPSVAGLLYSQPRNSEEALDIVEALVASNAVDVIVVDSVAGLVATAAPAPIPHAIFPTCSAGWHRRCAMPARVSRSPGAVRGRRSSSTRCGRWEWTGTPWLTTRRRVSV